MLTRLKYLYFCKILTNRKFDNTWVNNTCLRVPYNCISPEIALNKELRKTHTYLNFYQNLCCRTWCRPHTANLRVLGLQGYWETRPSTLSKDTSCVLGRSYQQLSSWEDSVTGFSSLPSCGPSTHIGVREFSLGGWQTLSYKTCFSYTTLWNGNISSNIFPPTYRVTYCLTSSKQCVNLHFPPSNREGKEKVFPLPHTIYFNPLSAREFSF